MAKRFRVDGWREFSRKLNKLRLVILSSSRREASALSQAVADRAKQLAPKRTGAMADSIKATSPIQHSGNVEAEVVCGEHYGWWVEFGTVNMAAQPFMRPASDEVARELPRSAKRIGNDLERV